MRLDHRPSGVSHNDMAHIHYLRRALGLPPLTPSTRTVVYGLEFGRWRMDWYDLWTQQLGRPEISRRLVS